MSRITPYTHVHCPCYYRIRTLVRAVFWLGVIIGGLYLMKAAGFTWDEARDTCEALNNCQP